MGESQHWNPPVSQSRAFFSSLLIAFETQRGKWSFFPPSQGSPRPCLLCPSQAGHPNQRPLRSPAAFQLPAPRRGQAWQASCLELHLLQSSIFSQRHLVQGKLGQLRGAWTFQAPGFFVGNRFWCTMQLFSSFDEPLHIFACFSEWGGGVGEIERYY